MAKYKIGDFVWQASFETTEKWIPCPTCAGKKFITVILGDDYKVTIDCGTCSLGYEAPSGRIKEYEPQAKVCKVEITGVEERLKDGVPKSQYYYGGTEGSCYVCDEEALADTKEEAEAIAAKLGAEYCAEENRRIHLKEKDTRSWAWNAHYHRQKIKQLGKELVYHRKKLDAARQHIGEAN